MEEKRPEWTNHISFIIASVGGAVGLGNIWRFPYIMGKNGGALFLFIYLLIIGLICAIPLCLELSMGKIYKKDPISIYNEINPKFKIFGMLCFITAILIPCFYFVVGGWIINYLWIFLINNIPADFSTYFTALNSNSYIPVILTIMFLILTAYFPYKGVNSGIEKANNLMMPLFGIILIALSIYSITLPGAKEGLNFMFSPNFSDLTGEMVLCALGQALFTLSIGMGAMMTYGSYLKPETNIKRSAYTLIFFDTLVAILAGVVIFPIVFSNGIEPTAGATLVFISLPQIFLNMPFGSIIGVIFFLLLLFAAITSGISLLETSICCLVDHYKIKREKAALLISIITSALAIPCALSFGVMSDFKIFDKTFFDLFDFVTSNIMLPIGTLIICLIGGWYTKNIADEAFGKTRYGMFLTFLLKYIVPIIFIGMICTGLR